MQIRWVLLKMALLPAVWGWAVSSDVMVGLTALQQIRTLIPERLSDEEFAIVVDRPAFEASFQKIASEGGRQRNVKVADHILESQYYLLYWTIAGEPVRLLDTYQQFEYGPFWRYPTAIESLEELTGEGA